MIEQRKKKRARYEARGRQHGGGDRELISDPERITGLVRACIQLDFHRESSSHCSIRWESWYIEKTAAHLIADQLGRSRAPQWAIRVPAQNIMYSVAVLINHTQQAWKRNVTGAVLMDVKPAFNSVYRGHLVERMTQLKVEPDLIRWTGDFMRDRKVRLVLNGQEGTDHDVDTGIPQGSQVSPTLFTIYLSGLFAHVEREVPGIKELSFVDDVAWLAEDRNENLNATLEAVAAAAQRWADQNEVTFDPAKTEAVLRFLGISL